MSQYLSQGFQSSQFSADSAYFSQTYTINDDDDDYDDDQFWTWMDRLREELVRKRFLPQKSRPYSVIRKEVQTPRPEDVKQTLIYYISELQKSENFPIGVLDRKSWSNTQADEFTGLSLHNTTKKYKFIGKRRAGQILTIMCRILEAMAKNSKVTKRYFQVKNALDRSNCIVNIKLSIIAEIFFIRTRIFTNRREYAMI